MEYTIIGDSCSDYTKEMKQNPIFRLIPLTLMIGNYSVIDDESFDQLDFIRRVKASPIGPTTACPSPEAYLRAYENADAKEIYVITLSEHLSGSYQSAKVAEHMFMDNHPDMMGKKLHVFSSDTANAGQCNLCIEIDELKRNGASFEEVVKKVTQKIDVMQTWFVLESLETLRKNGRLSRVKSLLATVLNIKPVMGADHGVIVKRDQQRGIGKALKRMVEMAVEKAGGPEKTKDLRVVIVHVNNPERALYVRRLLEKAAPFREIVTTEAMGVTTVYANDGGVVIAL